MFSFCAGEVKNVMFISSTEILTGTFLAFYYSNDAFLSVQYILHAFVGYVLVWAQMSGFTVSSATLKFFCLALLDALWIVVVGFVVLDFFFLGPVGLLSCIVIWIVIRSAPIMNIGLKCLRLLILGFFVFVPVDIYVSMLSKATKFLVFIIIFVSAISILLGQCMVEDVCVF
uniref:MARVEL domain-containing protein n=1 Tax=Ascaris lumbricoides TaxID=6252 RepID=A0A0M3HMU6_ASCLU